MLELKEKSELIHLIDRLRDNNFDEHNSLQLHRLLEKNPEAIGIFARYRILESFLESEVTLPRVHHPHSGPPVLGFLKNAVKRTGVFIREPASISIMISFLVLASTILTLSVIHLSKNETADKKVVKQEEESIVPVSVAWITEVKKCVWEENKKYSIGSELCGGDSINFKEGEIQISFMNGARVRLQGPVQIRLQSSNSISMLAGKSTFYIPQAAKGFTVETSAAKIVDLGTEFGVHVLKNKATYLQVKKGKVEVHTSATGKTASQNKVILRAGDAIQINLDQSVALIPPRINNFLWPNNNRYNGFNRWKNYSEKIRKDPSLLVYYAFDNQSVKPNALLNQAMVTKGRLNGVLGDGKNVETRPRWTSGRWESKGALVFQSEKQQRVFVPDWEDFRFKKAFTVSVWVRLDRQRHKHTIVTDFDKDANNFFHVSTLDSGLRFITNPGGVSIQHPSEHDKVKVGHWHHLVCICKVDDGGKLLYVDGDPVSGQESSYKEKWFPEFLSPLMIGGKRNGGSCLDGAIDEIAIFNRELSDNEIWRLYKSGKPSIPK